MQEPKSAALFVGEMKEYRAYVLTPEGVIVSTHYIRCESQEQAVERARQFAVMFPVELLDPPIRVARIEPKA